MRKSHLLIGLGLAICLYRSAGAETTAYTYDVYGQLRKADPDSAGVVTYGYDAAGNRIALGLGTNGGPTAVNDTLQAPYNTATTFDPRPNDTDPNGDLLTITAKTNGAHGTVAINNSATLTYTPTSGYIGADSFTYTVQDESGVASTATVTVNVFNSAPVAKGDSLVLAYVTGPTVFTRPIGSLTPMTNDTDADGDTLTITAKTNGARGTVSQNGATLTYEYNTSVQPTFTDTDSFTYTISDGHGHTATATVTVTIDVENNQ